MPLCPHCDFPVTNCDRNGDVLSEHPSSDDCVRAAFNAGKGKADEQLDQLRGELASAKAAALVWRQRAEAAEAKAAPVGGDALDLSLIEAALVRAREDAVACLRSSPRDAWAESVLTPHAHGLGALMVTASRMWRESLEARWPGTGGGAFAVGPCIGTVERTLQEIDAALAALRRLRAQPSALPLAAGHSDLAAANAENARLRSGMVLALSYVEDKPRDAEACAEVLATILDGGKA